MLNLSSAIRYCIRFCLTLSIISLLCYSATPVEASGDENSQAKTVLNGIVDLVKEYYPKAKVNLTGNALHFEFKAKKGIGYYSHVPVLAPSDGGIVGDVSCKPGRYEGKDKDRLPCEEPAGFYTTLVDAIYSQKENAHLLAELSLPADTPLAFKQRFKELINTYSPDSKPEVQSEPSSEARKEEKNNAPVSQSEQSATVQVSNVLPKEVVPGAFLSERAVLLLSLEEAKQQGVGMATYINEFNQIESAVQAGQDDKIKERIASLSDSLKHQSEAARLAKTQSAATTGGASGTSVGGNNGSAGGIASGGSDWTVRHNPPGNFEACQAAEAAKTVQRADFEILAFNGKTPLVVRNDKFYNRDDAETRRRVAQFYKVLMRIKGVLAANYKAGGYSTIGKPRSADVAVFYDSRYCNIKTIFDTCTRMNFSHGNYTDRKVARVPAMPIVRVVSNVKSTFQDAQQYAKDVPPTGPGSACRFPRVDD